MKIIIKGMLLAGLIGMTSCGDDFLELEPEQSLSINGAITDLTSLNAATLGVYSNFQDANLWGWDSPLIPDLRGDNVYLSSKNAGRFVVFDDFQINDQSGRVADEWSDHYEVVVNASNIINRYPEAEILETNRAEADSRLGESHAMRALAYWNLCRLFAKPYALDNGASPGVPLNNAGTTGEIVKPARATVAEVYTQVISDLTTAIGLIDTNDEGRISKEAAQGLLAKVYLYQQDWSNAEAQASAVINSGNYSLYANGAAWADSWGAKTGTEDLYAVVNTAADNLGVNSIGGIMDQDGYGDVLATEELYALYTDTDIRKTAMFRGDRADGEVNGLFPEGKYPNGETGQDYVKVLRLADIYLIRAEARAETGNTAGANEDLNAVASRVDPAYTPVNLTGQELIDAIIQERRKELAFEGDRVYDLMRRNMTWTKYRTFDEEVVTADNTQLINPIPRAELNVNPITQNPGY